MSHVAECNAHHDAGFSHSFNVRWGLGACVCVRVCVCGWVWWWLRPLKPAEMDYTSDLVR